MRVGIFHTAFIGDLALAGALVEALYLESHEISLITNCAAATLYKGDPRIHNVLIVDKKKGLKKISAVFSIAEQIKDAQLEVILAPHKSATTAFCTYFSGVKKRIGFGNAAFRFLYTERRQVDMKDHVSLRTLRIAPEWLISKPVREKIEGLKRPILRESGVLDNFLDSYPHFFKAQR